jgi:hypothetical protein
LEQATTHPGSYPKSTLRRCMHNKLLFTIFL